MKKDWEIYRDTGVLGDYHPESAVLREVDGGISTTFRDTVYTAKENAFELERIMFIHGKRFLVTSVFPDGGKATPTDKLLSLIDADLKKRSAQRLMFQ